MAASKTAQGEREVYADTVVRVTTSRVVTSGQTFALSNIASVTWSKVQPDVKGPAVLLMFTVAFALGAFFARDPDGERSILTTLLMGGLCLASLAGCVAWFMRLRQKCVVWFDTASGRVNAMDLDDEYHAAKVVAAIGEAIAGRG